jgi:hypothetical protein
MPAWKLKELEKEKERKQKEEEEAAKKNATAEAIQKRQMGMRCDAMRWHDGVIV